MLKIILSSGAKMSLTEAALEWKKEDFTKRFEVKDGNGKMLYNADEIWDKVQAIKKERKSSKK